MKICKIYKLINIIQEKKIFKIRLNFIRIILINKDRTFKMAQSIEEFNTINNLIDGNENLNIINNYRHSHAAVYGFRLKNTGNNFLYIGSSVNPHSRFRQHENTIERNERSNEELYDFIKIAGWDNIEKCIIENVPCNSLNELTRREQFYIDVFETKEKLNKATACIDITGNNYYNNSFIYKFVDIRTNDIIYIGSTCLDVTRRIAKHKSDMKKIEGKEKGKEIEKKKNGGKKKENEKKLYYRLNKIGIENIGFYVMQKFNCQNIDELENIEYQYIKQFDSIKLLNIKKREPRDYNIMNFIDLNTEINIKNFPIIRYVCVCGGEYDRANLDYHCGKNIHQLYNYEYLASVIRSRIKSENQNFPIYEEEKKEGEEVEEEEEEEETKKIKYKKQKIEIICECGEPSKNITVHRGTTKHKKKIIKKLMSENQTEETIFKINKIKESIAEKYQECECGILLNITRKKNMDRHYTTTRHKISMEEKNQCEK